MTKKEVIRDFLECNKPFSDYWAMQETWSCIVDCLKKDGEITEKQFNTWGNPCTPETFKTFNKKFKG